MSTCHNSDNGDEPAKCEHHTFEEPDSMKNARSHKRIKRKYKVVDVNLEELLGVDKVHKFLVGEEGFLRSLVNSQDINYDDPTWAFEPKVLFSSESPFSVNALFGENGLLSPEMIFGEGQALDPRKIFAVDGPLDLVKLFEENGPWDISAMLDDGPLNPQILFGENGPFSPKILFRRNGILGIGANECLKLIASSCNFPKSVLKSGYNFPLGLFGKGGIFDLTEVFRKGGAMDLAKMFKKGNVLDPREWLGDKKPFDPKVIFVKGGVFDLVKMFGKGGLLDLCRLFGERGPLDFKKLFGNGILLDYEQLFLELNLDQIIYMILHVLVNNGIISGSDNDKSGLEEAILAFRKKRNL